MAALLTALLVVPAVAQGKDYLTPQERSFLDAHKRIALIFDWKYPPFEFEEADGSFSGLAADLVKELESELGVAIVAEAERDWPTLLGKLKSRRADMAPAMAYTAERAEYLLFTDPYVHLPTVVFTQKDFRNISGLSDLQGMRVGVVNGYVSHTFLKNNYRDHFTIVPLSSIQSGLHAVAFGEVDAFVENVGVASYFIEKEGLRNLRVAAETDHQTALSMAVRSDMPLLHSAIQKALQHIPHERKRALLDKWVHPQERQIRTLTWSLYAAVALLSVMVLLLGVLLFRARLLRKDIQGKARELSLELGRNQTFQQALQQNEMYLRSILDNSEALIFLLDPKGALLFAGGRGLEGAGLEGRAAVGASAFTLFHGSPAMTEALQKSLSGQGEYFTAQMGRDAYRGACSPVYDEAGKVASVIIVATNVTELESVRSSLHMSEERLRFALEASSDGLWDWDYATGACYFSPRWFTMLGYEPDEMPQAISTWESLLHPAERARVVAAQTEALAAGRDHTHEYRMRAKGGGYRWVFARCTVVDRAPDGQPRRVVGVNADVTERREAQERYRAIFANAPIGIFRTTYDGKPLEANPALFRMLGYQQQDTSGFPVREVELDVYAAPEARGRLLEALHASPQGISTETVFKRSDGSVFPALIHASLHYDDDGVPLFLDGTVEDITERKNMERALRESEEKYRAIFNNSPIGIFRSTFNGGVVEVNAAMARMHGFAGAEEMLARVNDLAFSAYPHPEDRRKLLDALLASPQGVHMEFRLKRLNGETFPAIINASLHMAADGSPLFIDGAIEDITERKRAEDALREQAALLEAQMNATFEGILVVDEARRRVLSNQRVTDLFKVPSAVMANVQDDELLRHLAAMMRDPAGFLARVEHLYAHPDEVARDEIELASGSLLERYSAPVPGRDGKRYGRIWTFRDITERKRLELRLADQLAFQQALMDTIPYAVFYKNAETRFVGCNRAYEETFGIRREDFVGKRVLDLEYLPEQDRKDYQAEDEATIASVGRVRREMPIPFADGVIHQTLYSVNGFRQADGAPGGLIGVIIDISDLKRAEVALRESEARYRSVIENIQDMYYRTDTEGRIVLLSPSTPRQLGYGAMEEMLGRPAASFWLEPELRKDLLRRIEAEGAVQDYELYLRTKDGRPLLVSTTSAYYRDAEGKVLGVEGIFRDIAERKRMESALRASEEKYRTIFDNAPIGIFRTTFAGRFLEANATLARMVGYESSAELVRHVRDVGRDLYYEPRFKAQLREALLQTPSLASLEVEFKRRDGSRFYAFINASLQFDEHGRPAFLDGTIEDINERKRGEEALRASEARFRAFMDNLPAYVAIKDAESRAVFFNQRFLEAFPAEGWLGKAPAEVLPADLAARVLEADGRALAEGATIYTEERHDRQGHRRLLETRKFRIPQESGELLIGTIITDITEQRYNAEKYRVLFHSSKDPILLIKENRIVDCNPRTLDVFGCTLEQMLAHNPGEFSPSSQPSGRDSISLAVEMIERARNGDTHTFEWQHLRCDGTPFTAEVTLTVMDLFSEEYVVAFLRDVSERKQMQELMVQTEKMMSVGGLAAGMAHELNNPLGIILQSVQNMERRLSPSLPGNQKTAQELALSLETVGEYLRARNIDEYMRGIQEAGDRAAKIIRTMLDFSRSSQSVRATCPVNAMVDTALGLAANDYDLKKKYDFKSIIIKREFDQSAGAVECTETEIVQVLLNIIKNATQAMPGRGARPGPPELRLRTSRAADYVRIEIEDNGPGMDEPTRRRVFEPFFTTKPQGEGTGLGLSVGYFIITQKHKGRVSVESRLGMGTTFVIDLPLG